MLKTDKQLGQRLPVSVSDVVLYRCPTSTTVTYVKTIIVTNTTSGALTYSIWVNQNGTEVGDRYALIKEMPIAARASDQRIYPGDGAIVLRGSDACLMVASSSGSALNFTAYGCEVEED